MNLIHCRSTFHLVLFTAIACIGSACSSSDASFQGSANGTIDPVLKQRFEQATFKKQTAGYDQLKSSNKQHSRIFISDLDLPETVNSNEDFVSFSTQLRNYQELTLNLADTKLELLTQSSLGDGLALTYRQVAPVRTADEIVDIPVIDTFFRVVFHSPETDGPMQPRAIIQETVRELPDFEDAYANRIPEGELISFARQLSPVIAIETPRAHYPHEHHDSNMEETHTELIPGIVTSVRSHGLVIWVDGEGEKAQLAQHLTLEGVVGNGNSFVRDAYMSALDGNLLELRETLIHATGIYYDENPVVTPNLITGPLFDLDTSGYLQNAYLNVDHNRSFGRAFSSSGNFLFMPAPASNHFEEVMAYAKLSQYMSYMVNTFNLPFPMSRQITVDPTYSGFISGYDSNNILIQLLYGDSLDGDVIVHEFGHALTHAFHGYHRQYPFLINGEGRAINEGIADYVTTSFFGNWTFAEHSNYYRQCDNDFRVSLNMGGDPHLDGRIACGFFRDLEKRIGNHAVQRLIFKAIQIASTNDTFDTFFGGPFLQADTDLYNGQHHTIIRKLLWLRDILTAWPNPWPNNGFPKSIVPYTDNENSSMSHSIPGSSGLKVTFDPSTRFYWVPPQPSIRDDFSIRDNSGAHVGASPHTGESVGGETFSVAGDYVQFSLQSIVNNQRTSAGYYILNISAENPNNQPPVADLGLGNSPFYILAVPGKIEFDLTSSHDPDGSIIVMKLEIEGRDPVFVEPSIGRVTLAFPQAKIHQTTTKNLTLTVTDNEGQQTTVTSQIRILPESVKRYWNVSDCSMPGC